MRKISLLLAIMLFVMVSTMAVESYTVAVVESEATVQITNPSSPIMVRIVPDLELRQGETKPAISITNNMSIPIEYSVQLNNDNFNISPSSGILMPGHIEDIELEASDSQPPAYLTIPVIINATLLADTVDKKPVGSAKISTDLSVNVVEGELEISVAGNGIKAFWNDDDAPDGTEYYYRHRESADDEWSEWKPIDPDVEINHLMLVHGPGEYDFMARYNEVEANLLQPVFELTQKAKQKVEDEEEMKKYFNHTVEGLSGSDDHNN